MKPISITATTLPDAWFQALYAAVEHGRRFVVDQGSYAGQTRLELDYITIHIGNPGARCSDGLPLIPEMPDVFPGPPPTTKDYVREYARYLLTSEKTDHEQYTYGERLWSPNQVSTVIRRYLHAGHRNNQLVLQIARPEDLWLSDPPCLRHVDTRVQDGALHFFIYFRSWDLWGGMPANLAGLSMLHEYMASEIGVAQGEFVCSSKGLHVYGYAEALALLRCGVPQ